ncbi:MAG: TonB-dependent receptor [Desulfobacterales bacterium]|nr:TonB-dependent receptor [Desulfobacterales bacterium]
MEKCLRTLYRFASLLCLTLFYCLPVSPLFAFEDLTELSIEELANIEVTSVSRSPRKLSQSAAAIFVLTSEDIRRSGATTIPDALRLVPGIHVARISTTHWAISTRGFNDRYANKLLVQMDGRNLYTPLFSGVFWESHDTVLEDIDRIEVIRGPGASLWGSNAVNGIINIITKSAEKTQGIYSSHGMGTWQRSFGSVRMGDKAGENGHYRLFAKYTNWEHTTDVTKKNAEDPLKQIRAGFRSDFALGDKTNITLQGDAYEGNNQEKRSQWTLTPPYKIETLDSDEHEGHNLLSRFQHTLSETSDVSVQIYYDFSRKEEGEIVLRERTFDLDIQHTFRPFNNHHITWGGGYRNFHDHLKETFYFSLLGSNETTTHLFNIFLQDEIHLTPTLQFTIGTKVEHNEFTDYEVQPNARLLWMPNEKHNVWLAASRAVHIPTHLYTEISYRSGVIPPTTQNPLPTELLLVGTPDLKSENLTAFEVGYRLTPSPDISIDTTAFYYIYTDLYAYEPSTTIQPARIQVTSVTQNNAEADTWGFELAAKWAPLPALRFQGTYTYLKADIDLKRGDPTSYLPYTSNHAPDHQFSLLSSLLIKPDLTLDATLRYVDSVQEGSIPSYTEMDLRLGWAPRQGVEIFAVGQNLLDNDHPEFAVTLPARPARVVERSFHMGISIKF